MENRTFNEVLTIYGLERLLYRLSSSKYNDNFVLKGGILLYAIYEGKFKRGTADVDLLGHFVSNDVDTITNIFLEVFSIDCDLDGIIFNLDSLKVVKITEFKKYPGVNITIEGFIAKTKLCVQIDVGFGDTVYPEIEKMQYPTLIVLPAPHVNAYSKESIIAEKFQAIVSLGYVNTRMKDFYDIFALMSSFDFDYLTLKEAISETFSNRKTSFGLIVVFDSEFYSDTKRIRLWNSFIKTKHLDTELKFNEIVTNIQTFLEPMYDQTIEYGYHKWNHLELSWN